MSHYHAEGINTDMKPGRTSNGADSGSSFRHKRSCKTDIVTS
jgi:hypothetical protein